MTDDKVKHMRGRLGLQQREFEVANELANAVLDHNLTPVVDDDYPEVRRRYENALAGLLEAMKASGRFCEANRYALRSL